jgi:hypothetical protein
MSYVAALPSLSSSTANERECVCPHSRVCSHLVTCQHKTIMHQLSPTPAQCALSGVHVSVHVSVFMCVHVSVCACVCQTSFPSGNTWKPRFPTLEPLTPYHVRARAHTHTHSSYHTRVLIHTHTHTHARARAHTHTHTPLDGEGRCSAWPSHELLRAPSRSF